MLPVHRLDGSGARRAPQVGGSSRADGPDGDADASASHPKGSGGNVSALGAMPRTIFAAHAPLRVDAACRGAIDAAADALLQEVGRAAGDYARHAGRGTVLARDIELLLRRQRVLTETTSLTQLMRDNLPLEWVESAVPVARAVYKTVSVG
jgi:histone H3/H4